ncbi:MAG: alpha-amylase/alpha-mannosidase [Deltaproteobacteria bacterium]|nr:alpha-amylase/alpha-mannosidase [Deltaproteobacteria bacterium]
MDKRLNIAFVWHMHQPIYKDPFSGEYILPWVLLHGTKDYLDMPSMLEGFPSIKQTFNLVPSLIEQIRDYESDTVNDKYRAVVAKSSEELTADDKFFLLESFFQANWETVIRPFSRYWSLLVKRGFSWLREDTEAAIRFFSTEEYRDLQVLFFLSWIDPMLREKDEFLKALTEKGRNFSEDDKAKLLIKQTAIMRAIIPKYKEMAEKGQIELTVSPYFHPILPLLCDSDSAREAMPGVSLPKTRVLTPEDAREHVRRAIKSFKDTFGFAPKGMWPSEGSVSMEAVKIMAEEGINWIATDEAILEASLRQRAERDKYGHPTTDMIYKPYRVGQGASSMNMIFRDRVISDRIGFDYSKFGAKDAAADFMERIKKIHAVTKDPARSLVSVILDGENAWESYPNDGNDFFRELYSRLSDSDFARTVTVSEFLNSYGSAEPLERIASGSWINGNFKIWIGHQEDNSAWDAISGARDMIKKHALRSSSENEDIQGAWNALYAAEGSDWFWWYGDEHASMNDKQFDLLFRSYLKKVYALLGEEPPSSLDIPIISEERGFVPSALPHAFMEPVIDGKVTNYFEWLSAAAIEAQKTGGAMHQVSELKGGLLGKILYGFSIDRLFLRFDYKKELTDSDGVYEKPWSFEITALSPREVKIEVNVEGASSSANIYQKDVGSNTWGDAVQLETIKSQSVVEMAVPFSVFGAKARDELRLFIEVSYESGKKSERWPARGYLSIEAPDTDYEQTHWIV